MIKSVFMVITERAKTPSQTNNKQRTNKQIFMSGGDERKPLAHGRRASASSEDLCALTEK